MKIIQVAGFLGSGKTTTILELVRRLSDRWRIAVVVNEIGEIGVDGVFLSASGLTVKELTRGCICCQLLGNLVSTLMVLKMDFGPDVVFIEPTGIAQTEGVSQQLIASGVTEEVLTIVLVDASRMGLLLDEHGPGHLVRRQMSCCDVIMVSKVDLVPPDQLSFISRNVSAINPSATLIPTSCKTGLGFSEIEALAIGRQQ